MIKNLRSFRYASADTDNPWERLEPRKVIQALVNHSAQSLEELSLVESYFEGYKVLCSRIPMVEYKLMTFWEAENDFDWVPAHRLEKLEALDCESRWLFSMTGDVHFDGEKLSHWPFHTEDQDDYIQDPRNNSPKSLEYLCLGGAFTDTEWEQQYEIFRTENPHTPKLSLENTLIRREMDPLDDSDSDDDDGEDEDEPDKQTQPSLNYEVEDNMPRKWKGFGLAVDPEARSARPHLRGLWEIF